MKFYSSLSLSLFVTAVVGVVSSSTSIVNAVGSSPTPLSRRKAYTDKRRLLGPILNPNYTQPIGRRLRGTGVGPHNLLRRLDGPIGSWTDYAPYTDKRRLSDNPFKNGNLGWEVARKEN